MKVSSITLESGSSKLIGTQRDHYTARPVCQVAKVVQIPIVTKCHSPA